MKIIVITSEECTPCQEIKSQLKDEIASGQVVEKCFEKDPEGVTDLINKYQVGIPGILVLKDNGDPLIAK